MRKKSSYAMGEGRAVIEDEEDPAVMIALRTAQLIETKRKKEEAKKMARLMRNFNMELLRNGGVQDGAWEQEEEDAELVLEEEEAERLRILQEMQQELAEGRLLTQEPRGNSKYEAPLVTELRAAETVSEMYSIADRIIPLSCKKG